MLYSIAYVAITFAPVFLGFAAGLYLVVAAVSGLVFLWLAYQTYRIREGKPADTMAKKLFSFSILHLFLIFTVLLIEQGLGFGAGWTLGWN